MDKKKGGKRNKAVDQHHGKMGRRRRSQRALRKYPQNLLVYIQQNKGFNTIFFFVWFHCPLFKVAPFFSPFYFQACRLCHAHGWGFVSSGFFIPLSLAHPVPPFLPSPTIHALRLLCHPLGPAPR